MALPTWAMACASGVTRAESDEPTQRRTSGGDRCMMRAASSPAATASPEKHVSTISSSWLAPDWAHGAATSLPAPRPSSS